MTRLEIFACAQLKISRDRLIFNCLECIQSGVFIIISYVLVSIELEQNIFQITDAERLDKMDVESGGQGFFALFCAEAA